MEAFSDFNLSLNVAFQRRNNKKKHKEIRTHADIALMQALKKTVTKLILDSSCYIFLLNPQIFPL